MKSIKIDETQLDKYDNPMDGSYLINCCYPGCGCDGARNCMARKPNCASISLNREKQQHDLP